MTPQEFFDDMVAKIADQPDDFAGINWVIGYDFTPDDCGTWVITVKDGKPEPPFAGPIPDTADFAARVAFADFLLVQSGDLDPAGALNTNRMSFTGDPGVMLKLMFLLA